MPTITTTRRGFMQLSATSAAMLTVGASFASLSGCTRTPPASGFNSLRPGDIEFLTALAPVILHDSYPGVLAEQAQARLMLALDRLIGTLQEYAKEQLMMLLDVMQYAPLRLVMGAPWRRWSEMNAEAIEDFLAEWKHSSIQLKRMGYGSLCKMVCICWYKEPENFVFSGYPGMPKHIPSELNKE